jgi:hypothetical protein|tara:strand:- start:34 stop:582 length:549 start_codon:yes stop_codon:yes gene_type:complete
MSTVIYHNHHIIPRHAGGTDDPDNLVRLTTTEHAEAHRLLYEKYGRWQDKIAYEGLLGFKGKEEIIKEIQSRPKSEEHAKKIREMNIGRKHTPEAKKKMSEVRKGVPKSEETKIRMSVAFKGRKYPPQTEEHKQKNSEANRGEKNHFYGKKHSEESLKKMSESTSKMQKGKKRGPYKKRNTI